MESIYVVVQGCIGVGKSTFTQTLADLAEGEALFEPADGEGILNNPFLSKYYGDSRRWGYTMQVHLLGCRFRAHMYAQSKCLYKGGIVVADSSYWGDQCFAKMLYDDGIMTKDEYISYMRLHKSMQANLLYPTACISLHATPDICNKRIAKRMSEREGRKCESAIDVGYLTKLQNQLDLLEKEFVTRGVLTIPLDWNEEKSPEQIKEAAQNVLAQIRAADLNMQHPTWCGIAGEGL